MKSAKRQKKGRITEQDMSNLLHKYPAQKVLSLLREVSQAADAKMDWNSLVQKTATGITNPREYQMLWRHIAYCDELNEKVDDGAEPMDDDSDLEYELEPYPAISPEASSEAAACVKVLMGPGDSKVPNINITVPVSHGSVEKQSVSSRKIKPWSEEEDGKLADAVKKYGEGKWANIEKGEFKGKRTVSQLSHRWATIRKRKIMQGGGNQSSGLQVSDTNRALQVALCDSMPTIGNAAINNTLNPVSSKPGTLPLPNPRPAVKKAPLKPLLDQDSSMVTKVAVAAGARVASPSEATLFKAAQANMPFGSPLVRPSQPVRSTFMRPTVLPPPTVKGSTSNTLLNSTSAPVSQVFPGSAAAASRPNEGEVKNKEKPGPMIKVLPPPLPFTRPRPSVTIGAQPKPSPGLSSAGLVAPIQAAAKVKENSQRSVNTEKEKDGNGISKVSAVNNMKDKNGSLRADALE